MARVLVMLWWLQSAGYGVVTTECWILSGGYRVLVMLW